MFTKNALDLMTLKHVVKNVIPKSIEVEKTFTHGNAALQPNSALARLKHKYNVISSHAGEELINDVHSKITHADKVFGNLATKYKRIQDTPAYNALDENSKYNKVLQNYERVWERLQNRTNYLKNSPVYEAIQARDTIDAFKVYPELNKNHIVSPTIAGKKALHKRLGDKPGGLNVLSETPTPKERVVLNRLGDMHELHEIQAGRRAAKRYKRNITEFDKKQNNARSIFNERHSHESPEVLLREHNDITTLKPADGVDPVKIRNAFKGLRQQTADAKLLDPYLERIGGYGSTQRLSRHAIRRLNEKILSNYKP